VTEKLTNVAASAIKTGGISASSDSPPKLFREELIQASAALEEAVTQD
jgi:hypothetical protein